MTLQFNIEDIKCKKINELIQNPIIIILYIFLLAPMFTYAIFNIMEIMKYVFLDKIILNYIKIIFHFIIGFISINTAIRIATNIADISYNLSKKIYIMLSINNLTLFNNIFIIIFFALYSLLFTIVLLLQVDISLFITLIYIYLL
jgi:hypothetical protein